MRNYHLAILKKWYLDEILAGRKKIESRLTKIGCAPFKRIKKGDEVFLKQSCGLIYAKAVASKVQFFQNLTPFKINELKNLYNDSICGTDEYWKSKQQSKFATLVWLENIRKIEPTRINKKDWRAWVILTKKQDYALL